MRRLLRRRGAGLAAALLCACLLCAGCSARKGDDGGVRVLLDGVAWDQRPVSPDAGDGLRVYITYDGAALIDVPFGQAREVTVLGPEGGENTVAITEDAVYMAHADCDNQDCVHMGAVTRENLEVRVMGGFIVCLPHRLSVEVRA